MGTALFAFGLLAFLACIVLLIIACIVLLIISLIRKKPYKRWGWGIEICLVVFIIGMVILPSSESSSWLLSPENYEPTNVGATAILAVAQDPEILLAVDEPSFDALGKALLAKDWMGVQELINKGSAISVPRNTKVLVIDSGYGKRKVRVLEDKFMGTVGWVNMEFLKAP